MKKAIAIILTAAIFGSTFFGCSSGGTKKSNTPADSKTSSISNATGKNAEVFNKIKPLSDKLVTYKFVSSLQPNQKNFGDMEFFKELEKRTNVHIEWECYPAQNYGDQKNLMLSANQIPDAFFGSGALSMDDLNKYGEMGMFVQLDDLIAKNSPNYQKRLKENKLLNGTSTAFDGHKYSYGTVVENDTRDYPDILFMNKTWLDKLGLKVPTTLDEYYNVLKAFKEKDPNGNGTADEIPFTFIKYNHINGYGSLFGAFGRVDVHNGSAVTPLDHFVVENNKVVFTADKPEYKNSINGLSKFFKSKLFDQEGFVQEKSQNKAKLQSKTPIVGSFYGWSIDDVGVQNASQYIALTPLKENASAQPAHVHKRLNNINVMGTGFVISKQAKNPEILAKWVDLFYDTDISLMAHYGPSSLIPQGNGKYAFDETPAADGTDYITLSQQSAPYDCAPQYISADMYGNQVPIYSYDKGKMDIINRIYKKQPTDVTLPNINFSGDEIKFNTSSGMDIQNYVKEMQAKWLLGERDINKDWDSYLAQLKTYNLDKYVAQLQKAYDRTVA